MSAFEKWWNERTSIETGNLRDVVPTAEQVWNAALEQAAGIVSPSYSEAKFHPEFAAALTQREEAILALKGDA